MTFFQLDPFLAHPWYHLAYWLGGYAVLVATAPGGARSAGAPARRPAAGASCRSRACSAPRGVAAAGTAMGAAALALLAEPRLGSATCGRGTSRRSPAACSASGSARSRSPTPGRCGTATGTAPARSTSPRRSPALLLALVPLAHRATCARTPGASWPSTTRSRWLVAAPGAGPARAAPRPRAARRLARERDDRAPAPRPMTPARPRRAVAIASVIFCSASRSTSSPTRDRPPVRLDDRAAAHRRVPRRELLGVDDARRRLRARARLGPRPRVRARRT